MTPHTLFFAVVLDEGSGPQIVRIDRDKDFGATEMILTNIYFNKDGRPIGGHESTGSLILISVDGVILKSAEPCDRHTQPLVGLFLSWRDALACRVSQHPFQLPDPRWHEHTREVLKNAGPLWKVEVDEQVREFVS